MWTLLSLLKEAEKYLKENGIPSPRLETEVLLAHTLSFDRVTLYTHFSRPVERHELDRFRSLIKRRVRGEPTAYITGHKEFFSLPFAVSPHVLIPRPETEEVVQAALDRIPGDGAGKDLLDLCTGSGCIAVTLLKLKPALHARAVEKSSKALGVARSNAELNGVADRVGFCCGDLFQPLDTSSPGHTFHLITCNPPYVDPEGPHPVERSVAAFEPKDAVFAPPGDPLHYYRRVLEGAGAYLNRDGILIFEIGAGMKSALESLATDLGWSVCGVRKDLAGIERVILLRNNPQSTREEGTFRPI
jgi:release factor glutamine methyltransferase